jgi:hypothetical protein
VDWYISASSTSGLNWTSPASAPSNVYESLIAVGHVNIAGFDMETEDGWVSGATGDDATTGLWTRGNPVASAAQTEDDHSAIGSDCWFTGQANPGQGVGTNDVDNGTTTLLSPVFDLSGNPNTEISYWRWYVNNGNGTVDDSLFVDVTSDGSTWVNVETLGPGHPQAEGGWNQHTVIVSNFVATTSQVQLRFRAGDLGGGSIVEAAIDDFSVSETTCTGGGMSVYCTPAVSNSSGFPAIISGQGSTTVLDNNLTLHADQLPFSQIGYFLAATDQGFVATPTGSMGNLCLGGSLARFSAPHQIGDSVGTGSISLQLDLSNFPTNPSQPVLAGQTWYFQAWFRDIFPTSTSNFTDALSVTFQ